VDVGKLLVRHPVPDVDGDALHFGDGGVGAADRKQRHQAKRPYQRPHRIGVRIHAAFPRRTAKVMAMLTGIAASSTRDIANRTRPMVTNTSRSITRLATSRRLTSGAIMRSTLAIKRPTAAQETPARVRRNASTSP